MNSECPRVDPGSRVCKIRLHLGKENLVAERKSGAGQNNGVGRDKSFIFYGLSPTMYPGNRTKGKMWSKAYVPLEIEEK